MGRITLADRIREFVSYVAFKIFLWSIQMTKEQYWKTIQAQENWYDKSQAKK